jgi:hypothetical protein
MKPWLKWKSENAARLLIALLFLSHVPLLTSDPDQSISFSRGPFTDEGLNTIQVRNFINHGELDLAECDNLLKTPLFGMFVGVPMYLFGARLEVARLTVLIFLVLALIFLSKKKLFSQLLLILVPILFFKYQVFHFSRFSLAEIPSSILILLGIYHIYITYQPNRKEKQYIRSALLAGTFFSLAYYFKIQFLYIALLPLMVALERAISSKIITRRILILNGLVLAGTTLFFLVLYLLAWYLPSRGIYDHMMAHQSGGFELSHKTWEYFQFNLIQFMFSDYNILFTLSFIACMGIGVFMLFRKSSSHYPTLFKATIIWLVLELHKLTMVYLPTRYQISLFVSMGLIIAIVIHELIISENLLKGKYLKMLARPAIIIWIVIFFILNLSDYGRSLKNRTYHIREANHYLATTLGKEELSIGAWAPSITWGSKSKAIPVWGGFLNDEDPLNQLRPRVVVSEPDEQDSEQAYSNQGIDLLSESDSLRTFQIGNWAVNVYWLKKTY